MLDIYKHSHFLPDALGHGGNKRTAQIDYLLSEAQISVKQAQLVNTVATGSKLSFYLTGLRRNFTLGTSNNNKYAIGRYKAVFEQFVKQHKPDLFIWESTVAYQLILAEVLYKHNIPVIALPHNLESLVTGTKSVFSNKHSPQWLFEELSFLKLCKKVFTISHEEYWLLSNCGISAGYLPYYPAPAAESFLLDIRKKRYEPLIKTNNGFQNILLLGTFHNLPTVTGFIQLLQHIIKIKGLKINVVGFGSEKFKDQLTRDNVEVWGSVNSQTLASLITASDCAVVHQQPSSGALTRIPELLMAGLPVVANTHAARSCDRSPGLSVYDSYEELASILSGGKYFIPSMTTRPPEEKVFSDFIKSLI